MFANFAENYLYLQIHFVHAIKALGNGYFHQDNMSV